MASSTSQSTPDLSLTATQNDISVAYPQVPNSKIINFTKQRNKYFKGTIAVAVIYSALLIGLIILTFFTKVLYEDFIVFIATLSVGIIIVVILLVLFLYKNKPEVQQSHDTTSCPDYWISTTVPDSELKNMGISTKNQPFMKTRCVPNPAIMKSVYTPQSTTSDSGKNINLLGQKLYGEQKYTLPGSTNIEKVGIYGVQIPNPSSATDPYSHLLNDYTPYTNTTDIGSNIAVCNMVYPDLMSSVDNNAYGSGTSMPNKVRCAYANLCGIPWTDACATTS